MKSFEETRIWIAETCHHYIKEPFEIRFNFKDTKYLGRCQFLAVPRLTFNVPYIKHCLEHDEFNELRDTVLHEIAHVLAGRGHGHDNVWKEKAREIGIENPKRCSDTKYHIPYKWKLTCSNCGKVYYQNRFSSTMACGDCCKKYNNGKYSTKYILDIEELN